ncbi:MAG: tRNA (adenosine(37)-N6)-dimethylallyltransferase MiaA [Candidatus Omnitrophica bacterium]|nr:tRNA (adenosine(37)-N6)-dimethylallyltransferase MiaA [Candidatus Omnitrophota bacterium]
MDSIVFITGPTAVGKTAVSLSLAKRLRAEIISCDSMQIYKGMDIGTQKPTPCQRRGIIHHMIDIAAPSINFSAADFCKHALKCLDAIEKKGRRALITGGTALYIKSLVDGLFVSPPADYALREELSKQEALNGRGFLHKKLSAIDHETADKLHPNDTRRVIRALEVCIKAHSPISELRKNTRGLKDKYDIKIFYLNRNRQALYDIINKRVDAMFRRGFVAECRRLKKEELSMTARQALGYVEVFDYLDNKISLDRARELIKQRTRNYAKRQLSWFRNDKRFERVDIDGLSPAQAARILCKKLMK